MIGAIRIGLVVLALAAVALGGRLATAPPRRAVLPAPASDAPPATAAGPDRQRMDSLTRLAVLRTPFRAARVPAGRRFQPGQPAAAAAPARPQPKPAPVLAGVVWGAPPAAVLEGIPGVDGARAVRRGDSAGGLTVRRIAPDRIVLAGYDTVWTLKIKEPWR